MTDLILFFEIMKMIYFHLNLVCEDYIAMSSFALRGLSYKLLADHDSCMPSIEL